MLISALCIPEKVPCGKPAQEHEYPITTSTSTTSDKDRLLLDYLDRESEFSHACSPRSSTAGSPREEIFDRAFSESVTPSPEPAPNVVSGGRQKRPASDTEDNNSEDEGPEKKQRLAFEFACPFYKRNRSKYCHQRSCRTSGWPSVHRVKEHLYRHHMHYVCERCSTTFKAPENLKEHLRQQVACSVSAFKVPEDSGFDLETEKKLRSRKKIDGQTEVDKWLHMFQLLFPDASSQYSPSPFVDYSLQEELYPPTIENEEALLHPDFRQHRIVNPNTNTNTDDQNLTAIAQAAEQQISAAENNGATTDNMLVDHPALISARDRIRLARQGDDEFYRRSKVSKIDFYEIVRDEVRAIMSSLPHRAHTTHGTD
ncbi:hypothetical protein SEUCBS139899_006381 [Sporothrix eucalyptigena]|uniref:C2H2-type domain-containing protein n=1 Tax=Sporothrix eucalyptigena TaxID=1812306 RepID=A0ABP0BZB4_9PEZI